MFTRHPVPFDQHIQEAREQIRRHLANIKKAHKSFVEEFPELESDITRGRDRATRKYFADQFEKLEGRVID